MKCRLSTLANYWIYCLEIGAIFMQEEENGEKKCVLVQIVKDLTVCGAEHEAPFYFPYVHNAYINYPKSHLLVLSTPTCLFL